MMERKIVGYDLSDIDKLTPDGLTVVVIPGPIRREFGDISFNEASEIINNNETKYRNILNDMISEIERQINTGTINYKVGYSLMFDINIKIGGFSYSQFIKSKLNQLKLDVEMYEEDDDDDELPYVEIRKNYNPDTERSLISRLAKKVGITVRTESHPGKWLVRYKPGNDNTHPKATGRGGDMTHLINQWLATVEPMVPTKPPAVLIEGCTDSYFRTVINKSPFHVSYRRGYVIVYPCKITDGTLYIGTKPHPAPANDSTSHLDMVLAPYGYDHTHVMKGRK